MADSTPQGNAEGLCPPQPDIDTRQRVVDTYSHLLEQSITAEDPVEYERLLAEAFESVRRLPANGDPSGLVGMHDQAIQNLARKHPHIPLRQVADRLTVPLMEVAVAHCMACTEHKTRQYRDMVDQRLEHSNRLETIGTLAAGIAHDFNNILGCILGFAELTAEGLAEDTFEKENMRQIHIACLRGKDIVNRMLSFARSSSVAPVLIDLIQPIREMKELLKSSLGSHIDLIFDCEVESAQVLADPGEMQQIVMNLCINAADAMNGAGEIRIGLRPARAMDEVFPGHEHDYCLTVMDHGSGMPPEVQAKIFDPFFTTKAPHGSGLGLSVIHGIVTHMGGIISLRSHCGGTNSGTEFRIFLPQAAEPVPAST